MPRPHSKQGLGTSKILKQPNKLLVSCQTLFGMGSGHKISNLVGYVVRLILDFQELHFQSCCHIVSVAVLRGGKGERTPPPNRPAGAMLCSRAIFTTPLANRT